MDFVILKVNGEDVSNATHEEAVAVFCKAKEPIFIEVLRRQSGANDTATTSTAAEPQDQRAWQQRQQQLGERYVSVSTQTDWDTDGEYTGGCFYDDDRDDEVVVCNDAVAAAAMTAAAAAGQVMLDSCMLYLPPPPPLELVSARPSSAGASASGNRGWNQRCSRKGLALSAGSELCLTDLENAYGECHQQRSEDADSLHCRAEHSTERWTQQSRCHLSAATEGAVTGAVIDDYCPSSDGNYGEIYTYEEVILQRESPSERVGLTLCYALGDDGSTCVLVGEVEVGGAASADGRIREGDRILEINGEAVDSREAVIRLFSVNQKDIRLLVCRLVQLQWDDDGFVEEPSQDSDDVAGCPATSTPITREEEEEPELQPACGYLPQWQLKSEDCVFGPSERAPSKAADASLPSLVPKVVACPDASPDCSVDGMAACYQEQKPPSQLSSDTVESKAGSTANRASNGSTSSSSGGSCGKVKPRMGTRLVQSSGPGTASTAAGGCVPRAGSVGREGLTSPSSGAGTAAAGSQAALSAIAGRIISSSAASAADCMQPVGMQTEESSGHDTAYNTAESCRSASLSLKPQAADCDGEAADSQAWLSRGGSMLSLVLPTVTDEASSCQSKNGSCRDDSGNRSGAPRQNPLPARSRTGMGRDKQARGSLSSSGGSSGCGGNRGHVSSKSAASRCATDVEGMPPPQQQQQQQLPQRGSCDIMYTNKENLATTMALQQKLLEQRLAAALPGGSAAASRAEAKDDAKDVSGQRGVADAPGTFEWVLKRRPDGSRYVVRRPVAQARAGVGGGGGCNGYGSGEARPSGGTSARSRLLEERQRRLERERASMTTDDDDAASELKMGRYWSRADRRRHLVSARDSRRRKEERLRGGRATIGADGCSGEPGMLKGLREEDEGTCVEAAPSAAAAARYTFAQASLGQQRLALPPRRAMDMLTVQELMLRAGRAPELLTVTTV